MTYDIHSGAIWSLIPNFLSDGISKVCSTFHRLRDIRKWNKMQKFDFENEGESQVGQNESCANRLEMLNSI